MCRDGLTDGLIRVPWRPVRLVSILPQVVREFDLHAGAAMLDHVMVITPAGWPPG